MKKLGYLFACAGVAALIGACSSSSDSPPDLTVPDNGGASSSAAGSVKLHDGTSIVPQNLADVADVREDSIVFPATAYAQLAAYKAGDVLISDRQSDSASGNNPDGFLRKVKSVTKTAEGTVVATDAATLQEAVDELKLHASLDTPDLGMDGPVTTQGVTITPQAKGGKTITLLDYSKKNLFEFKDVAKAPDGTTDVPYTVYAGVDTGTLGFSPSWDVDADVGFLKLNSLTVKGTGKLEAKLIVAAGVKLDKPEQLALIAGKGLTKSYSTTLADYKVKLGSVKVGIVNFPTSVKFNATLNCDFNFSAPVEAKVGGVATGEISAGLTYADGKLSPSFDKSASFEVIDPTFSQTGFLRANCTVTPKFQLLFFGSQTLDLTANAFAGLGGSQTCGGKDAEGKTQVLLSGDAEAGVSAKVGATINLFGLYKWKKECTLFDLSASKRWEATFPYPNDATCTVQGPYPLPPRPAANPSACFGDGGDEPSEGDAGIPLIPGTCTHDVCTAGEKLGQQCDDCTMKVCAADPYCCDTFWGLSCFDSVEKYCQKKCGEN